MRIWLDPDRLAAQLISPAEVIEAIQSENRQAAAGKIGGQPAPPGLVFEYPILTKGRLATVAEFEEIIVRRRDDGSIVRLGDVARIELDSENYETSGWLSGKPAGTLPVYQYSDANALDIVKQVRESMDRLAKNFPPGLEYRIAYDTTKYVHENIVEVAGDAATRRSCWCCWSSSCSFRACGRRSSPCWPSRSSLVATFAMMAAFGFSINTLTLCGLVLAIGLVVDDAIIVVENVEKYLERGERPLQRRQGGDGRDHRADRHDHAGAGRGLRPGGVHPRLDRQALQPVRHDDRLLVRLLRDQLADVQPGDGAAVPAAQARRDEVLPVPLVQPGHALAREFVRRVPRVHGRTTGGRSSSPRSPCWR